MSAPRFTSRGGSQGRPENKVPRGQMVGGDGFEPPALSV
jgi:hypothetical protein